MREVDRLTTEHYAVPSLLLMETAANASARAIAARFSDDVSGLRMLILCGRGNNGGDGAALARLLSFKGARVEVVLFGRVEDAHGDARTNFEAARSLASAVPETGPDSAHETAPASPWKTAAASRLSFTECTDDAAWRDFRAAHRDYDVIVDALFGTGLTRPLEGIYAGVVRYLAQIRDARHATSAAGTSAADMSNVERSGGSKSAAGRPLIVSLDLPSGLNADTAALIGDAVQADLTVTFTAPKPANVLPPASYHGGELLIAPIGSPAVLLDATASQLFLTEEQDARVWLEQTRYRPASYKNTHGHALVVAGSRRMSGAAVLCGDAAMRSGAGLVTIASPASALSAIAARVMPEVMTAELVETTEENSAHGNERILGKTAIEQVLQLAARADAIAIGPGLTSAEHVRRLVRAVVERRACPVVIDADGLNALSPWPADLRGTPEAPLILTPHPGEMRRLLGADAEQNSLDDRVRTAREFAVAHEVFVVSKGARVLIAAPDGRVAVNPTGNAGTGTAGAGDTLTGIVTGCIAQSRGAFGKDADAYAATVAAVYLAGLAADLTAVSQGMRTLVASDISRYFGAAVRALDPDGERP
ncbi:MAG TPA: NAD(P)H-hydrate dehydratase [Pyrinomonadaceae bacterium]|nr:NAD(P)H-hydrate dehydratase [Pyrinomonadaceae bacterium]